MASGKQILSRGVPSRKSVGNSCGAGRTSAETVRQDQSLIGQPGWQINQSCIGGGQHEPVNLTRQEVGD